MRIVYFSIMVILGASIVLVNNNVFAQSSGTEPIKEDIEKSQKTVVIEPLFTQAAYAQPGFYNYYTNQCSRCLTIHLPYNFVGSFVSSGKADSVLKQSYDFVTDLDVDKNPKILKKYDKVIVLHNEYVTIKEFDAITNHPHVIYLYPNALYAQVSVDYNKHTLLLIRGHGYPHPHISNGFNWKFDNSKLEYDTNCQNWSFHKINNGMMLNCYPEKIIKSDESIMDAIESF
ncbi:MAG TPA: hypothetical protein VEU72_01405 [Nitrosopumilaceae archaeon]|nr:hypothetical protein [Nitrosopumilaceae archaeon]